MKASLLLASAGAVWVVAQDATPVVSTLTYTSCTTPTSEPEATVTQSCTHSACTETWSSAPTWHTTAWTTTMSLPCPEASNAGWMRKATVTVTESCSEATPTWSGPAGGLPQNWVTATVTCKKCGQTGTEMLATYTSLPSGFTGPTAPPPAPASPSAPWAAPAGPAESPAWAAPAPPAGGEEAGAPAPASPSWSPESSTWSPESSTWSPESSTWSPESSTWSPESSTWSPESSTWSPESPAAPTEAWVSSSPTHKAKVASTPYCPEGAMNGNGECSHPSTATVGVVSAAKSPVAGEEWGSSPTPLAWKGGAESVRASWMGGALAVVGAWAWVM